MKIAGIYLLKSTATGKVYIGESLNLIRRIGRHKTDLKYGCHGNVYLQRHCSKYGVTDLTFQILEELPPAHQTLLEREKFWVAHFDSSNPRIGFNLSKGGLGGACTTVKYKNFILAHIKTGDVRCFQTANDFEDYLGKEKSSVRALLSGHRHSCCGWTTVERMNQIIEKRLKKHAQRKPRVAPPKYMKKFKVFNRRTNETASGENVLDFSIRNGLCYNSMLRLIRGERKSHKGWVRL